MNVTEVTTIAGSVAALGVIALIASGWRQPARVERSSPRRISMWMRHQFVEVARWSARLVSRHGGRVVAGTAEEGTPTLAAAPPEPVADPSGVLPTPWWHRARSIVGGTGLAIWMGALTATIVGFGASFVVVALTSMLRR